MNLFVTGAAGCLGTELCILAAQRGHNVLGVDNGSRYELLGEQGTRSFAANYGALNAAGVKLYRGDFRSIFPEVLDASDVIIHAAAQVCHSRKGAADNPMQDVGINVLGTVELLEKARVRNLPFLFISSSKLYGENFDKGNHVEGIDETCPIGDQTHITFFGASKAAADLFCQMYAAKYGLTVGVFRPGCFTSKYALAAEAQNFLAWLAYVAKTDQTFHLYGDGSNVRDHLHARDLASACLRWLEAPRSGVWNIGGGIHNARSVNLAIHTAEGIIGRPIKVTVEPPRAGDIHRLIIDNTRITADLGWEPTTKFDDILRELLT